MCCISILVWFTNFFYFLLLPLWAQFHVMLFDFLNLIENLSFPQTKVETEIQTFSILFTWLLLIKLEFRFTILIVGLNSVFLNKKLLWVKFTLKFFEKILENICFDTIFASENSRDFCTLYSRLLNFFKWWVSENGHESEWWVSENVQIQL